MSGIELDRRPPWALRCPLCAGPTQAWCAQPCRLAECTACGFVFQVMPPADPARLYHRRRYDRQRRRHGGPSGFERFHHDLAVARNRVRYVLAHAPRRGVWLDVGTGNGAMLVAAEEAGFEPRGVEVHARTAEELTTVLGRPVRTLSATLEEGPAELAVLSFYDVLEHSLEPSGVLCRLAARIGPGGVLAVEVPDAGSARARNRRGWWKHVKPGEHLGYFTEASLCRLVARCGPFRLCERVVQRDTVATGAGSLRVPAPDKLHLVWRREARRRASALLDRFRRRTEA